MADSAENKPSRSQADKERSRQQSRQVNAREAGKTAGGRSAAPSKGGNGSGKGGRGTGSGANGAAGAAGRSSGASKRPQAGQRPASGRPSARAARGGRPVRRPTAPGGSRSATALLTWGVVAVVLVIVVVLVVVKVVGGSTSSTSAAKPGPVPASVLNDVTHIPVSVYNTVGVASSTVTVATPTVEKGQKTLTLTGKPGLFFMGGEYCPYCAADRWAVVATLSRFGTIKGLDTMASSSTDVYPSTQTFTFAHSKYTSTYVTAALKEVYSNVPRSTGSGYETLDHLTKAERSLVSRYDVSTSSTSSGSIPFLDIGNQLIFSGASYSPAIFQGLSRQEIASDLSNPKNVVTKAVISASNYMSAGICSIDGAKPASVCTSSGVTAAAKALGIAI